MWIFKAAKKFFPQLVNIFLEKIIKDVKFKNSRSNY